MPKSWNDLGVSFHKDIQKGIKSFKFNCPTPVQAAAIPQLINKKDVVAEAVTGSGKTLAFLIPMLEILKQRGDKWKKHEIGGLIISPTRELALQTSVVLTQLLKYVKALSQLLFVGGNSVEEDLKDFKTSGGNIIICTPGRFEDLLVRKTDLNLATALKSLILVLDEADRLLDFGFHKTIDIILSYLPRQRRTGLFSATQTKQLQDLIRAGLRNPVLVSVNAKAEYSTPEQLDNYYVVAHNDNKLATLVAFLKARNVQKGILFLPTCATVDYWSSVLPAVFVDNVDLCVLAIHGKMKEKRKKILEQFKIMSNVLLLCTDVLARGIDIAEVDWVLQWDPPTNAKAFVHRVGRTARQGRQGSSLILLLETEKPYVHFIGKNQRIKLEELPHNCTEDAATQLRETIQNLQRNDRDVMERATRAFVSHVRAYSKHECSIILRVKELPFGRIATTYGLLQFPKMPELKNADVSDFQPVDVDVNTISYKDKQREVGRLRKLDVYKSTGAWPGHKNVKKKSNEPWSEAKLKRQMKKDKKLKRKGLKDAKCSSEPPKKKLKASVDEQDLKELLKDIALMKKLKKKKITEEEFDKEFTA